MSVQGKTPEETYAPALGKAKADLAALHPNYAADRAGVVYEATDPTKGTFQVPFFGVVHHVHRPDGIVERTPDGAVVDIATQLVVLHYLITADGAPMAGRWMAFRNLPGGLGYDAAFQGRASLRVAQVFGSDKARFEAAARALGGEPLAFGDSAFNFRVFPRLWMAVVLNLADDEFRANANFLFDAAAGHYLPTEDLAVLGGLLAGRLIRAGRLR